MIIYSLPQKVSSNAKCESVSSIATRNMFQATHFYHLSTCETEKGYNRYIIVTTSNHANFPAIYWILEGVRSLFGTLPTVHLRQNQIKGQ